MIIGAKAQVEGKITATRGFNLKNVDFYYIIYHLCCIRSLLSTILPQLHCSHQDNCFLNAEIIHRLAHCLISTQKWKVSQTKIRVFSTLLFILFGCLIFVALPAVIFKHIEGWSTLESIYFVVITLTTIGFGDFVAGEKGNPIFFLFTPFVYLQLRA